MKWWFLSFYFVSGSTEELHRILRCRPDSKPGVTGRMTPGGLTILLQHDLKQLSDLHILICSNNVEFVHQGISKFLGLSFIVDTYIISPMRSHKPKAMNYSLLCTLPNFRTPGLLHPESSISMTTLCRCKGDCGAICSAEDLLNLSNPRPVGQPPVRAGVSQSQWGATQSTAATPVGEISSARPPPGFGPSPSKVNQVNFHTNITKRP